MGEHRYESALYSILCGAAHLLPVRLDKQVIKIEMRIKDSPYLWTYVNSAPPIPARQLSATSLVRQLQYYVIIGLVRHEGDGKVSL